MKKIFIGIFAAIFVGVFALNINYQLRPVDNIWGLSNAVADGTNTTCATGWSDVTNAIAAAIVDFLTPATTTPTVKHWNSEVRPCSAVLYRKQNAAVGVTWKLASDLVGFNLDFGFDKKFVTGSRWQSILVDSGGKYARQCEAETECVPKSTSV